MALIPGTRLGPYEVRSALGAGGMGEVFRARDTRLDRDVAIKVLPAGSVGNEQAEARFDREARAIAALSHPNICALFDVGRLRISDESAGQSQEVSYLVMELLEGDTLHDRLARGPLDIAGLVDHAINLADALDTAHARGMLHRDLKPANLFLTSRGQIWRDVTRHGTRRGGLPRRPGQRIWPSLSRPHEFGAVEMSERSDQFHSHGGRLLVRFRSDFPTELPNQRPR